MTNISKQKGTAGETAVVRYLRTNGFPGAERRALYGNQDRGDLTGLGPLVVEVKAGTAAETASPGQVDRWMAETLTETRNAHADYGILVCKRAGVGPANAGQWWAYVDLGTLCALMGSTRDAVDYRWEFGYVVTRLLLADVVTILRHAGYGDPVEGAA